MIDVHGWHGKRVFPAPGELLHFSEDPTITRFEPHVAATAQRPEAYVWAVDAGNAPSYNETMLQLLQMVEGYENDVAGLGPTAAPEQGPR